MKKFRKTESKIGPLIDKHGETHSDAKMKANLLQEQYTQVFSDPAKASTDHLNQTELDYSILEDITFTIEDVKKSH